MQCQTDYSLEIYTDLLPSPPFLVLSACRPRYMVLLQFNCVVSMFQSKPGLDASIAAQNKAKKMSREYDGYLS